MQPSMERAGCDGAGVHLSPEARAKQQRLHGTLLAGHLLLERKAWWPSISRQWRTALYNTGSIPCAATIAVQGLGFRDAHPCRADSAQPANAADCSAYLGRETWVEIDHGIAVHFCRRVEL